MRELNNKEAESVAVVVGDDIAGGMCVWRRFSVRLKRASMESGGVGAVSVVQLVHDRGVSGDENRWENSWRSR